MSIRMKPPSAKPRVWAAVTLLVVLIGATIALVPRSAPAADALPGALDRAAIAQGATLAFMGDCVTCHTAPNGRAYAGGRALQTPFGTVYGTNITPDPQTGIGQWTEAAFVRAMRHGVDRDGRQLYPVFPYEHFQYLTDTDLHALYAFLMTREAISARPPPNQLRFPYNIRPLIAIWKAMYLRHDALPHDTAQPEWSRGAYLVVGLGHCGACHTPRNALGAEEHAHPFAGGEAEGWHAPALDRSARTPVPWSTEALASYLRGEIVTDHEVAGGPMAPVVRNLAEVPTGEVRAIATYLQSLQPAGGAQAPPARAASSLEDHPGAKVFRGACAMCHGPGREAPDGALRLGFSTSVAAPTPANVLQIVLHGIIPPDGEAGPWMPAFGDALTDQQLADLLAYLRLRFSSGQPWPDVEREARRIREHREG